MKTETMKATLERGMEMQLAQWRAALAAGASRTGWKIGFNHPQTRRQFNLPTPLVGYLTGEHTLTSGDTFHWASEGKPLIVEAEVAIRMGQDVPAGSSPQQARQAIAAWAPAIELISPISPPPSFDAVLAGNIFHRAAIFGPETPAPFDFRTTDIAACVVIDGEEICREQPGRLPDDLADFLCIVADTLGRHGETLSRDDWVITGSVVPRAEIQPGQRAVVEVDPLGRVSVNVA